MKTAILTGRLTRRMLAAICVVLLIFIVNLLTACNNLPSSGIIVAGSTSIQPYAEVLAEDYMILHPDVMIDIQGGGSSAGIMAAQSGTADIGMSSRLLKESEASLWSVEIARDGLAVIVHPSNPILDLTLDQIRDIYAAKMTNWEQLGGISAKIHIITREEGSGTRDAFENLVMGKTGITPRAIVQDSNGAVRQLVADDPNSIGFISLGLVNETVKALHLGGITATRENVTNGSYGLSRPFIFISSGQPAGLTRQFIDFIQSEDGEKILTNEGLITSSEGTEK